MNESIADDIQILLEYINELEDMPSRLIGPLNRIEAFLATYNPEK